MPIPDDQLDEAVARGIITAAQRDALAAMAHAPAGAPATSERAPAITIAYAAGAACVLLAFGWVLVERWERLGPSGVLIVSLLYAAVFAYGSIRLRRESFPLAAAFGALLAVGMTPIATWSLLSLAGWWPAPYTGPGGAAREGAGLDTWLWPTRWAVIELATALVALLAWRATRFAPLVLPIAIAAWLAPLHIASAFYDRDIEGAMFGWGSLAMGAVLFAVAYHVERIGHREPRQPGGPGALLDDPAGWIFRVIIVAYLAGVVALFDTSAVVRHGLVVLAVAGAVAAVRLGRRELLTASALAFVAYLGYLAFDVFEDFLSFPVLLATFGIGVIGLAVAVQRRWPAIATRLADGREGRKRMPGNYLIPALLFAITVTGLMLEPPRARERVRRQAAENVRLMREARERQQGAGGSPREAKVAAQRAGPLPRPAETPPRTGP